MHTRTLIKLAFALTFGIVLQTPCLRAQIFTAPLQASTTGTNPVDFEFRADGTMIAKGNYTYSASLLSTDQGGGTRLLWFPSQGAFRVGSVSSGLTCWDQSNIGPTSMAFGQDTTAYGYISTAMGDESIASGLVSTAMGQQTSATGMWTTAMGFLSTATGNYAATAIGYDTTASGDGSTSMGVYTRALGTNSTAAGCFTTATAQTSFVVGLFNVGGGNPTTWVPTDPLFEIGNGTATSPSDAMLVDKSGNVTATTFITKATPAAGDIPMFGH